MFAVPKGEKAVNSKYLLLKNILSKGKKAERKGTSAMLYAVLKS